MKILIKKIILLFYPLIIFILNIFYHKKYLKGKHFEGNVSGFRYAVKSIWVKNILRLAKPMPFPTALTCLVSNPNHIHFHPDDLHNFQSPGTYFQNFDGHIYIGYGTYIAPNVGIITSNHDLNNLDQHDGGFDVILGQKCWIGMNSVILPGVELGDNTVVAAGAVVTKSFPQGHIVIAGVPAKIVKEISKL